MIPLQIRSLSRSQHLTKLRITATRYLAHYIINQLNSGYAPDRLSLSDGEVGRFLCTLDIGKFYCGCLFLRMAIDAHNLTKIAEERVDVDDCELLLWDILDVDRVAARIDHPSSSRLLLARL